MNVTSLITVDYENKSNWKLGENKANQSQSKPIQTQYEPNSNPIPERPKMNENLFATKVYENITTFRLPKNKANSKPIQTQFPKSQNEIKLLFNKGL